MRRCKTTLFPSGVRVSWWFREPEEIVGVEGGSESVESVHPGRNKIIEKSCVQSAVQIESLAQRCV